VFQRLFPPLDRQRGRRLAVLDVVAGNLDEVAAHLGGDERRKLDLHRAAIADLQGRLNHELGQCEARRSDRRGSFRPTATGRSSRATRG
jgi:hypothetical protein